MGLKFLTLGENGDACSFSPRNGLALFIKKMMVLSVASCGSAIHFAGVFRLCLIVIKQVA